MQKKTVFIVISLLIPIIAFAQHAIGSWQTYMSYHNVTHSEPAGTLVYAIGNGSLFSYDKEDTSVQCYQKDNPLSDTDIAYIAYQSKYKTLIIVYSNANIDLLVNDKDVYNLPDYMNKNISLDKDINHIYLKDEYAYLSTSFGIVILNVNKKEISNAYILNKKINSCAVDDAKIYAASSEGLYTGLLAENLLDVNNWNKVSDAEFSYLSIYANELVGSIPSKGIYRINKVDEDNYNYSLLKEGAYSFMYVYGDKLLAGNDTSLALFDGIDKCHYIDHGLGMKHLSFNNGIYWASCSEKGLVGLKYNESSNQFLSTSSYIIPNSPKRNLFHHMNFQDNTLLAVGGSLNYSGVVNPGTFMIFRDGEWINVQEEGIKDITGREYKNLTSAIQDPTDSRHHFASSARQGLYEYKDYKFFKLHSIGEGGLEGIEKISNGMNPNYVSTNGLIYDDDNNLWMVNNGTSNTIKVLKPDGKWVYFNNPDIKAIETFEYIIFDQRGWLWVNSMWNNGSNDFPGFYCLDYNRTIDNVSDDRSIFLKSFVNQDGTSVKIGYCYCLAEDKNGVIWVGTDKGPLVINNPSKVFDPDFYVTQIKVPRNDGTNLADYLLANDAIITICIDGANRKWIGTRGNGVYLLSEDGMETVQHFTAENSPLLSNIIQSIVIDPTSGEVYIGTSKGLNIYQSDATEAEDNFSDAPYAYPNPVRPDYTGVITVTGLVKDSDVKITNTAGKLIHSGTSNGGIFTWNGRNTEGKRVPSGIYFVLAADKDGKQGIATKILMIK